MRGGHWLKPDWLPDTCRALVPDIMRLFLPVLLATRLCQIQRGILGTDGNNLLFTWTKCRCNISSEGSLSALVCCDKLTVHPYMRTVVYCTTVQEQPFPGILREHLEGASIPHNGMKGGVADTACRRFRWKWYLNSASVG